MQVKYDITVRIKPATLPDSCRHLFASRFKDILPVGRYEVRFDFKQMYYEQDVQVLVQANPKGNVVANLKVTSLEM